MHTVIKGNSLGDPDGTRWEEIALCKPFGKLYAGAVRAEKDAGTRDPIEPDLGEKAS
ncbi:MAG: hypothetical protein SH809_03585 [Rhodothermales bacterium]|nr:hypothetical protein [Rhodothermales bacterium]